MRINIPFDLIIDGKRNPKGLPVFTDDPEVISKYEKAIADERAKRSASILKRSEAVLDEAAETE